MFQSRFCKAQLVGGLLLLFALGVWAQTSGTNTAKKTTAPPPKPAQAPVKPAPTQPAPKTSSGAGTVGATPHPGSIAPSANRPAGPTANGPKASPLKPPPPRASTIKGVTRQQLSNGGSIERRPDGRLRDVHDAQRGMDIHHGMNGGRRVSVMRGGQRIVAERGRPGFVERPYNFHGHEFARRTYYYHGHVYDRFYRSAYYHGLALHIYAPVRFYSVGFYGWVYNPWRVPVTYSWGWGGSPWVGYYGSYFVPYPVYPSASFWLTDYMISSDLAAAYDAGKESGTLGVVQASGGYSPELTPEVKALIAEEVQNQIALENNEAQQNAQNQEPDPASSGIARMLGDGRTHVFVAGSALDVVDASGAECALSEGDVLQLLYPPAGNATAASLVVLSAKGGKECAKSETVNVALDDLQEMQNHMRETIDRGMEELQAKQGKGGLPAAPPSAMGAPTAVAFAQLAPPPDTHDGAMIDQQLKDSDQAEQELNGSVPRL